MKSFKSEHYFRDKKTRGVTENKKQQVRYALDKEWAKFCKHRKQNSTTATMASRKLLIERKKTQKNFSLQERSSYGYEAISKFELMIDIVALFALELRDSKFLDYFVKNALFNSDHFTYLAGGFFLRPPSFVIKEVVSVILLSYSPINLNYPKQKNPSYRQYRISDSERQKTYQIVRRAYDFIAGEYEFHRLLDSSSQ